MVAMKDEFFSSCCCSLTEGRCFFGARAEAEIEAEPAEVALFGLFLFESSLTLKDPRSELVFNLPFPPIIALGRYCCC